MSRHDPRVRLRHMLAYATEAVTLMRDRRRADLDIDRAGESSDQIIWPLRELEWAF